MMGIYLFLWRLFINKTISNNTHPSYIKQIFDTFFQYLLYRDHFRCSTQFPVFLGHQAMFLNGLLLVPDKECYARVCTWTDKEWVLGFFVSDNIVIDRLLMGERNIISKCLLYLHKQLFLSIVNCVTWQFTEVFEVEVLFFSWDIG